MTEQIMQVEVRATLVDLNTGERTEISHEEHCEDLTIESWQAIAYRLGSRMLARTADAMAATEHNRMVNP